MSLVRLTECCELDSVIILTIMLRRKKSTFDALYDDMLTQQLLCALAPDVRAFVLSKQPTTSEEASNYADLHTQMARTSDGTKLEGRGEPAPTRPPQVDWRPAAPMQGNRGNGLGQSAAKRLASYNVNGQPSGESGNWQLEA